ncbi:MAG TPA: recombinase family protein [Candidatus Lokiarchaeia archaeon]|nr:recombinase family protein [Candidatus Lokiarchaeia archaeon]
MELIIHLTAFRNNRSILVQVYGVMTSLAIIEGQQACEARFEGGTERARSAVYCRVSSREQKVKGDLARQVATATRHCMKSGFGKPVVFTDIGSGLNATRPGLARLCK